jgi:hypothetical protein
MASLLLLLVVAGWRAAAVRMLMVAGVSCAEVLGAVLTVLYTAAWTSIPQNCSCRWCCCYAACVTPVLRPVPVRCCYQLDSSAVAAAARILLLLLVLLLFQPAVSPGLLA